MRRGFISEKGRLTADMEREIMREKARFAAEERQRADAELERQRKVLLGDPGNWEVNHNLTQPDLILFNYYPFTVSPNMYEAALSSRR
jgi:hypothetical protein